MKNKLRKLVIRDMIYFYKFTTKYFTSQDGFEMCKSIFKAFKGDSKNTPLIFSIETLADIIIGNPLNVGIDFENRGIKINLNCPKWARFIILYGLDYGWNGMNSLCIDGNYDLLKDIEKRYI